jgi:hypothetical protein
MSKYGHIPWNSCTKLTDWSYLASYREMPACVYEGI